MLEVSQMAVAVSDPADVLDGEPLDPEFDSKEQKRLAKNQRMRFNRSFGDSMLPSLPELCCDHDCAIDVERQKQNLKLIVCITLASNQAPPSIQSLTKTQKPLNHGALLAMLSLNPAYSKS